MNSSNQKPQTDDIHTLLSKTKSSHRKNIADGLVEFDLWDLTGTKEYFIAQWTHLSPDAIYIIVVDISEDEAVAVDDGFDSIGGNSTY